MLCRGNAEGQRGTAHPCWQQQERNLCCFALPCLSSENRSMCWFSGARIRNRGAEAKTVHSAGSKQESTRCPSCSHKWHRQISLKGLKGVCRRWEKTQQCMDLWAPRGSLLQEVNSSVVVSGLLKMWPVSLENCFPWLKLLFRLLKAKTNPFQRLVMYYSHVYMF